MAPRIRKQAANTDRSPRPPASLVLAFLGVAALSGCAATTPPPVASPSSGEASLESIVQPILTEQMERMEVPGLVAIVQSPDGEVYRAALGLADIASERPMALRDHLRIGSITKTMTATVILQLVDEGMLSLDDPLARYLPDAGTNGATVRQALDMSSGIPPYTSDAFMRGQAADPAKRWTPQMVLAIVADLPATFPPGEGKEYSNTNYTMLGMIAEQVGGAPLSRLLTERIFAPLGMDGCSADAEDTTIPPPRSRGYQWGDYWDGEGSPPPIADVTDWNMSWGFGTGEAICTAEDMLIWARALYEGALLKPATQQARLEAISDDSALPYGLGIADLGGLIGHNGSVAGFQAQAAVRESDGTVIVVLTNLSVSPDLEAPATTISAAISQALPPQ